MRTLLALLLAFAPAALPQGVHPVSGRVYAPVMGAGGANWLVRSERETEENPTLALKMLALEPGMRIADIGAGVGYWSLRMAEQAGPKGKVYAVDIQPEMLRLLRKRIEKAGVSNVEPVLGGEASTNLPANTIDLAILVDVYHEFAKPQEMLRSIASALKADGTLVLLEFRKEDASVPIREEHKMSVATVKQELEAEGYRMEKVLEDLPWQHMFFFKKAAQK
ncbi:MAG: methyltransferase domain-containing protein [Bryobacteraceae bacterium]